MTPNSHHRSPLLRHSPDAGSVFVELLWCLPAFFAGITLIVFVGTQLNARSSLQDAVTSALALAATRSGISSTGSGSIAAIDRYVAGSSSDISSLRRFLVSSEYASLSDADVFARYAPVFSTAGSGNDGIALAQDPSALQLYAMTYLNQAMEVSSLGEAKFPCDLSAPETGCITCSFFPRGSSAGPARPFDLPRDFVPEDPRFPTSGAARQREFIETRISLACRYRPAFLLEPILRMMSAMGMNVESSLDVFAVASIDRR